MEFLIGILAGLFFLVAPFIALAKIARLKVTVQNLETRLKQQLEYLQRTIDQLKSDADLEKQHNTEKSVTNETLYEPAIPEPESEIEQAIAIDPFVSFNQSIHSLKSKELLI